MSNETNIYTDSERKQDFYNQLLQNFGGNYQAFYMPSVYKGIASFFLKHTGQKYPESRRHVDEAIRDIGHVHHHLEEGQLDGTQKNILIKSTIDVFLILLELPRTIKNRLEAVEYIFPDYLAEFKFWISKDYIEADMAVVKEVRQYLLQQIQSVNQEELMLKKNPAITFGQSQLKAATEELLIWIQKK